MKFKIGDKVKHTKSGITGSVRKIQGKFVVIIVDPQHIKKDKRKYRAYKEENVEFQELESNPEWAELWEKSSK